MKTIKIILAALLLITLIQQGSSFDPSIDDWYAVEDWELEVCSMWGGTDEAMAGATSSSPIYLSQTTLSLQGKKQEYNIAGVNQTLYTISWYFEPMEELGYMVELVDDSTGAAFKIEEGTATMSEPAVGFHAEYYDIEYTAVRLWYGSEWLKVPLINLE